MKLTRRSFIKFAGALAAAFALPKVTKAKQAGGYIYPSVELGTEWMLSPHDETIKPLEEYSARIFEQANRPSSPVIITTGAGEAYISYDSLTFAAEPTWSLLRDYPEDDLWVGAS